MVLPYSTEGDTKVEILQKCSNFIKGRKNVRILVWKEHAALIKNIEIFLERPNTKRVKYWFCDNCTYWFTTHQKYETHESCTQTKPKIVCPKIRQIKFKNHYKQEEVMNVIHSDIKFFMDSINKKIGDNTFKISDHVLIAVGISFNGDYGSYFDPSCINDYVKDLWEIETENIFKLNKQMIYNKEDKLYYEANNTCHIRNKPCINKMRDHCHETGKNGSPACNVCNLNYKQQKFLPVIFHNGKGYDFNLIFNEILNQNKNKT